MNAFALASVEFLSDKLNPVKNRSTYKAVEPPKRTREKELTLKQETFVSVCVCMARRARIVKGRLSFFSPHFRSGRLMTQTFESANVSSRLNMAV
jgi:hypothetical protein